jgi:hypothetical protein
MGISKIRQLFSPFRREIDFGIEGTHEEGNSRIVLTGDYEPDF